MFDGLGRFLTAPSDGRPRPLRMPRGHRRWTQDNVISILITPMHRSIHRHGKACLCLSGLACRGLALKQQPDETERQIEGPPHGRPFRFTGTLLH